MNKHIKKMDYTELVNALNYCNRVANDRNAPVQLRDEARDLATSIGFQLEALKAGAQ